MYPSIQKLSRDSCCYGYSWDSACFFWFKHSCACWEAYHCLINHHVCVAAWCKDSVYTTFTLEASQLNILHLVHFAFIFDIFKYLKQQFMLCD